MELSGQACKAPIDRSADPHREPGPIDLQRYQFTPADAGIATLFGVPLCLNQDAGDAPAGSALPTFTQMSLDQWTRTRPGPNWPQAPA
jgi:hypothetical protein